MSSIEHIDHLFDITVDGKASIVAIRLSNSDLNWSHATVLSGHTLNFFWPGGTEHESLSIRVGDEAKDLSNIFLESHIKHPVSLIKNKVSAPS